MTWPACKQLCILFQQDGAPSPWLKHMVAFLQTNVPDFIDPPNWPPNTPDLNSMDYCIWGALQQLVYRQKIEDVDHLKQLMNSCWDMISQELINRWCYWLSDWLTVAIMWCFKLCAVFSGTLCICRLQKLQKFWHFTFYPLRSDKLLPQKKSTLYFYNNGKLTMDSTVTI